MDVSSKIGASVETVINVGVPACISNVAFAISDTSKDSMIRYQDCRPYRDMQSSVRFAGKNSLVAKWTKSFPCRASFDTR